jgi:Zn finger protein HypA/HybF involved in hydrogenase expression
MNRPSPDSVERTCERCLKLFTGAFWHIFCETCQPVVARLVTGKKK